MNKENLYPARKNRICNFRAPDDEWFKVWIEFQGTTKSLGLDICHVALSLFKAWIEAHKTGIGYLEIGNSANMIFVWQTNEFNYNVGKPRRERFQMDCSKNLPKCTLCSRAFQAYIVESARELDRSFSFRDFLEINHDQFRKLILVLKKRQKILPMFPRANPETYILTEWKERYPSMSKNNTVKPDSEEKADDDSKKGDGS